jgi:prevent-host-death family protein
MKSDPHISTMDLRERMGDFLDRVRLRSDRFIVERKGEEVAALVPVAHLRRMEEYARLLSLDYLDRSDIQSAAPDELHREISGAIAEVRSRAK